MSHITSYFLTFLERYTLRIPAVLFCCLSAVFQSNAQLTIQPSSVATQLAAQLAGPGVTILNPVLHCPSGASATFSSNSTNLGLNEGILLTTGQAKSQPGGPAGADGPATLVPTTNNGAAGDPVLGNNSGDACVLDFDFIPIGDTIQFSYVFASEEYSFFNCTKYNDIFGFYISGPGTSGNIALVPGTSVPVAINSINNGIPGVDGDIANCTNMGAGSPFTGYYVDNTHGRDITYDGFTVPLMAKSPVQSCEMYHLKLAIADIGDRNYDSGIFLAAGSLTSNPVTVKVISGDNGKLNTPEPYCIRGCAPGRFEINRHSAGAYPLTVRYTLGGTAQNGIDYAALLSPGRMTIPANDSVVSVNINPLVVAGALPQSVVIKIFPACDSLHALDSAKIMIRDSVFAQLLTPDTTICKGDTIRLRALCDAVTSCSWSPVAGLANALLPQTSASPVSSTIYTLSAELPGCPVRRQSVTITVQEAPSVNIGPDREVCQWDTLHFDPLISPAGNYTYSWTPSTGINFPGSPSMIYTGQQSGTLSLAVSTSAGCTHTDSVYVTVFPHNFATLSPADTSVCPGDSVVLRLSGATSWRWSAHQYMSDTTVADPVVRPLAGITYDVWVTNDKGCHDTVQSVIHVLPQAVIYLPDTITFSEGETIQLDPRGNCLYYQWFPADGLSSTTISNPVITPVVNTLYYVQGTTEHGCVTHDSVAVLLDPQLVIDLPNAFTPGNGPNNILKVVHKGVFELNYFRIYNRWGEKVFETTDINEGWDGRLNGKAQPLGAYVYMIGAHSRSGKQFFKQGNVTLLR